MNDAIIKVIQAVANDIYTLVQTIMDENDLKKSALKKDVQVKVAAQHNPVIDIVFNSYLEHIENGRAPYSGKMPPISDLRDWAQANNVPTDNKTLYSIANGIWKTGVAARPILSTLEEKIENSFRQNWAGQLFDAIVGELNSIFSLE